MDAARTAPARAAPRLSLWAAASLVCSLLVCPPLCIMGPVLGLVGLAQTRPGRGYTGRRLAVAGIAAGVVVTSFWIAAFAWWHVNVRRPILAGPRDALAAGLDGDAAAFAAAFNVEGAAAPVAEAEAFLAELRARYGRLEGMAPDVTAPGPTTPESFDPRRPVIPYLVRFERGAVAAEAQFVRGGDPGLRMVLKWGWLVVRDPERGDLVYPVSASGEPGGARPRPGGAGHDQ